MNRTDQLLRTIDRIRACEPPPAEVLVLVDGGDGVSATALRERFPDVRVIESTIRLGPGGGRNRLVAAAAHECVASFDDDSFPVDSGYFGRLAETFAAIQSAAVIAARIFHAHEPVGEAADRRGPAPDFVGCGCAFRRSAFLEIGGFVPIPLAYGMEESDFALRAHAKRFTIVADGALRVRHDTTLVHHRAAEVTSASLRNLALLAYLRYPPRLWWLGAAQVARRAAWLVAHGRLSGLLAGVVSIPGHLLRYRAYRQPLGAEAIRDWHAARRRGATLGAGAG